MNKGNSLRRITSGTVLFLLLLILMREASAFRPGQSGFMPRVSSELGLRTGYDFDVEAWSFGAQFKFPMGPGGRIKFIPSADFFFIDSGNDWQINLDAALRDRGAMYLGGGLAISNRDFSGTGKEETNIGVNLLAGLKIRLRHSRIRPYIEGRWTFIEEENPFRLVVGFNLPIGGRRGR